MGGPGAEVLSVGFDIGTTTSHMVISRLTVGVDPSSCRDRYIITSREAVHEGEIFFTPFESGKIDLPGLEERFSREFERAEISREAVDTGAVVLTGEAAASPNAREVVHALSEGTGRFVSAAAGPHYESILAARGSGTTELSRRTGRSVLHVDIGGGTSNLALVSEGTVVDTACILIGGRLLRRRSGVVVSMHDAIHGFAGSVSVGGILPLASERGLCEGLADSLMEVICGRPLSDRTRRLMLTPPLGSSVPVDSVRFSGGVAEYIYGVSKEDFGDIGMALGEAVRHALVEVGLLIEPPGETVRATVIGAGAYTLQLSGPTTRITDISILPMKGLRMLPVPWRYRPAKGGLRERVASAVRRARTMYGDPEKYAVMFEGPIPRDYSRLRDIAMGLIDVLRGERVIVIVCEEDVGRSLGNLVRRETGYEGEVIAIDEVEFDGGDVMDIGEPVRVGGAVPVTVRSLVFRSGAGRTT